MKRTILLLSSFVFAVAFIPALAQVAPSATGHRPTLSAGALFSYAQPDYDPATNKIVKSTNHLYGIGAFADYRINRWVQVEAEGRWQRWNQTKGFSVSENTYSIGIREPIHTFFNVTPYGKALIGFGTGDFLTGRAATYTFGGGLDYRLKKRLSLRADFEYQHWRVDPALKPYIASIGFSYRIF